MASPPTSYSVLHLFPTDEPEDQTPPFERVPPPAYSPPRASLCSSLSASEVQNLDPLGKVTSRAEYAQVKLVVMPISSFSISRTVKRKVSPESHCTLFEEGLPFVSKGEAFSNATCLHLSRSLKLGAYGNG
ncbi:unnamed protein product [Cochlearia groenlandica]